MEPVQLISRFYTISLRELAYLTHIIDSYEGLATVTTVDRATGLIEITFPACMAGTVDPLLAALAVETGMDKAPPPPGWGTHGLNNDKGAVIRA